MLCRGICTQLSLFRVCLADIMLVQESGLLWRLRHPSVVGLIGISISGTTGYLLMVRTPTLSLSFLHPLNSLLCTGLEEAASSLEASDTHLCEQPKLGLAEQQFRKLLLSCSRSTSRAGRSSCCEACTHDSS